MNSRNLYRLLLVIFVTAWSFSSMYPWKDRDLIAEFQARAANKDDAFKKIVDQAQAMQSTNSARAFGNLRDAVGTADLTKYFPTYNVKEERNPSLAILYKIQKEIAGKIKKGLDIQGGSAFLVGVDMSKGVEGTNAVAPGTNKVSNLPQENAGEYRKRVLSQAVEVLRKRVDRLGVAEPLIQPEGDDRILIQLPGLSQDDIDNAKANIQKAAYLEFRLVHPKSSELLQQDLIEPGYVVLTEQVKQADGKKALIPYLVKKNAEKGLTGKHVEHASVIRNPMTNQPEIEFTLNPEGSRIFAEVTRDHIGEQLAIVLDGELYSAPVIRGEIPGGRGVISGRFDTKEAFSLATALENPLEKPIKILDQRSVDPSLGKNAIDSGVRAAKYGTIAVCVFMLCYYMFAGLVANIALIFNIIITVGVMCAVETTWTLPGIAGMVLTIGMAVDANVLIYERIREEMAKGKSLRGAIAAGYDRAFSTIFDSHVTTLISSVILIYMGTGPVKGFGVTLTIGVSASLFTALIVTRLIFDFVVARNWLKNLRMLHIIKSAHLDFMKLAKPAFIISWSVIIIGLGFGVYQGKKMFGVDFVGGDSSTFEFKQKVDAEKLSAALKKSGEKEAFIQYQRDLSGGFETVRITTAKGTAKATQETLKKAFPEARFSVKAEETVGATVGEEIQQSAIIAALLSLFGILVYVAFRYEFSFAVGAVIAVLHDVLMTIGCYCLSNGVSGRQFNATVVAALLTIIGFSINDTIVIFDRIREDLKMGVRGSFRDLINQALNQTLSRTIITSGTVFLATMSLYLFGGGVINDFAFTFLVGIITGTYSSIYIASALVLWWHKGQRPSTVPTVTAVDAARVGSA